MRRFLAQSPDARDTAFQEAGAATGFPAASVEKDFWVCVVLRELFLSPELNQALTFKGGTSLSKTWGLIDRFSEDLDLTLDRDILGFGGESGPEAAKSGKDQRRRLQALRDACRERVRQDIRPALTLRLSALTNSAEKWFLEEDPDDPDSQTLLFEYPRHNASEVPVYLSPIIKLEFGARSDPWPVEERPVMPTVAERFPDLFDDARVVVRALLPERTFWEKAMLLHEERFRPSKKPRRARMARHYYDVSRLIERGIADRAAEDKDLFDRVVQHRRVYFHQNWVDYTTLRRGAIKLLPEPGQEKEWREDYEKMRREMFATEPPAFDQLMETIRRFQDRFNGI